MQLQGMHHGRECGTGWQGSQLRCASQFLRAWPAPPAHHLPQATVCHHGFRFTSCLSCRPRGRPGGGLDGAEPQDDGPGGLAALGGAAAGGEVVLGHRAGVPCEQLCTVASQRSVARQQVGGWPLGRYTVAVRSGPRNRGLGTAAALPDSSRRGRAPPAQWAVLTLLLKNSSARRTPLLAEPPSPSPCRWLCWLAR